MTKSEAIQLFGGSVAELALGLEVSPQAVYQWPEVLPLDRADRVRGAAVRLGRWPKSSDGKDSRRAKQ